MIGSENRLERGAEKGFRGLLPFVTTLGLVLLMQLQYRLSFLDDLFPFLSLVGVYYWSIFKPRLMPVSVVFLLGLLQDILSGGPIGMMALLFILVRLFVIRQGRRFLEREFLFNWLVFIMVSPAFGLATWAIASLYLKESQNIWNIFGQSILTIVIFPLVTSALGWVRYLLADENR